MNRTTKDWLIVLVLLLDDAAALALVLLVLWVLGIKMPLWVTIVIALLLGTFAFITHKVIIPSFHKKKVTGAEGMIGLEGEVIEPLTPFGVIRVGGEYWKAKSVGGNIDAGEEVEILGMKKLTLEVKRSPTVVVSATGAVEPGYIALYWSGELERRAEALEARLRSCDICPRECSVNRLENELGFCYSACLPVVSVVCAHYGEEPAITGSRGSGAVFLGNCNMRCVYCQNHQISQDYKAQQSREIDAHTLAERMLYLQDELGCHNINFVSPSHFVPQLVRAVLEAVPMGLRLPLVYNTSGYDSLRSLRELDGVISIYLADLRYASNKWGKKFSQVSDYVEMARAAIQEMYRQVGDLVVDGDGIAQRGLIVRHLILPNRLAGSQDSLAWLAHEVSPTVTVSIMSQYFPAHRASQFPLLARTISPAEYSEVTRLIDDLGLENGWLQGMGAAKNYLPDFAREGEPFSSEAGKLK